MHDADYIAFLQRVLPKYGMRWKGYRKVRRQVCRRITRRLQELGIDRLERYEALLEASEEERRWFDAACRITISRFFRDRDVFQALEERLMPSLLEDLDTVRCWSAGCASGEEPYSIALLWHYALKDRYPGRRLILLATDADEHMLARARRGEYPHSAVINVPREWRADAFHEVDDDTLRLDDAVTAYVTLKRHDVREDLEAEEPFHIVLCRNVAFMYYEAALRESVLQELLHRLHPGGYLVVGRREVVPERSALSRLAGARCIYRYQP